MTSAATGVDTDVPQYRIEHDTMGEVRVPAAALYRAQTQRAVENFPVSGQRLERAHIAALARIKVPAEFVRQVNSILTPGATVFVTSEALSPQNSGRMLRVVDADPPAGTKRS